MAACVGCLSVTQDVHERLGHFNVPTSVIERLGVNQRDIPGVTKLKTQQQRRQERRTSGSMSKVAQSTAGKRNTLGPGRARQEHAQSTAGAASMRIEELEKQLIDVRDHYIKKVRELHRKLEHYQHGGAFPDNR